MRHAAGVFSEFGKARGIPDSLGTEKSRPRDSTTTRLPEGEMDAERTCLARGMVCVRVCRSSEMIWMGTTRC